MIFNDLTLTLELLEYYYDRWKIPPSPSLSVEEVERKRKENAERVIEITKWAFIHALSCMEFTAKETLKLLCYDPFKDLREKLLRGKDYVYLGTIIGRSRSIGLIDEECYETWEVLRNIRNIVVHNNAKADVDAEYRIDGMRVVFIKGETLKGKLDFFIRLIEVAIERYRQWLQGYMYGVSGGGRRGDA